MIKPIFLSILISFPPLIFSQNILILDSLENNLSNQIINHLGNTDDSLIIFHFGVKNTFNDTLDIKMKRYEIGKVPGSENYFCWSICYTPESSGAKPVWTDMGSIQMKPDSIYENFSAYYIPNGNSGIAGFKYVLFDTNNPEDSTYISIFFDVPAGIANISNNDQISIFPNPISDKLIIKSINNFSNDNLIEIYNLLGEKTGNYFPENGKNSISINTSLYLPGIYFCAVKESNVIKSTQKFIISK